MNPIRNLAHCLKATKTTTRVAAFRMYVMLMSEVHQRSRVITNALVVSCQGWHSPVHHACLFVVWK